MSIFTDLAKKYAAEKMENMDWRKALGDVLKPVADGALYTKVTNLGYMAATGMTAKQLQQHRGATGKEQVKKLLTPKESLLVELSQKTMYGRLLGRELDRWYAENICMQVSREIWELVQQQGGVDDGGEQPQ